MEMAKLGDNQQVSGTLKDRSKRLDVEIADNEENVKLYASSAEKLQN